MVTSLRYGVDSKALKIHANERFAIDSSTHLQRNSKAAVEVSWSIYNFHREQDVRFRIGYEVPYLQIRKNNWTLNADMNGKWNVKFDL
ncbi:hypothetical protein BDE02_16G097100 [Populus trichocarpa]|nr:hypothetical protein BDE02_16G097100 [Populus trichocarpa]